jgi:hypothetical protein
VRGAKPYIFREGEVEICKSAELVAGYRNVLVEYFIDLSRGGRLAPSLVEGGVAHVDLSTDGGGGGIHSLS